MSKKIKFPKNPKPLKGAIVYVPKKPGEHCPICYKKLDGTMITYIIHLYTTHPQLLPKVETDEFNPSARGKTSRDMSDIEYIELVKILKRLEKIRCTQ